MNNQASAMRPRSGQKRNFGYKLLDWLTIAVISFGLAAFLLFVVFSPVKIEDTGVGGCDNGDLIFADRFSKYIVGFDRGDALVLKKITVGGDASGRRLVRAIAFAGEKVTVSEGKVYIDGALLDESAYTYDMYEGINEEFIVPTGSVFVLPDDRMMVSKDNMRELIVELPQILGEVRFIAYPFDRLRAFK